jgi:membrane peptidoglycan carboxypeptidase
MASLASFLLCTLSVVTFCAVIYVRTQVPTQPQDGVTDQGSVVYYDDGNTPIVRLGAHRQLVGHGQIPEVVRSAVLAAEDRGFWSEPGISPSGLVRAAWTDLTGGDIQGGSTITQQLARNYYKGLSRDRTVSRKFKEIFIAVKLSQKRGKADILDLYLNTVYFGRQSFGVQAAARAYFHKDVWSLDAAQSALLAAMIQRPAYFKTQGDDAAARALRDRWQYVVNGMVAMGKLTPAAASRLRFPAAERDWDEASGQLVFIEQRLTAELQQLKISPEEISTAGLKIYTGLDKNWMDAAEQAMDAVHVSHWPRNLRGGLISVDPRNGEIKALYGGDPKQSTYDTIFSASAQAGSTFKPYVLATALKEGYSVRSLIDGRSPERFDPQGNLTPLNTPGYLVRNDDTIGSVGTVDLVKATALSVNTAFVRLGFEVGLDEVMRTAEDFGVPADALKPYKDQAGISLGIAAVPAVSQAAGYAPFANGGTAVTPHLITKIVDSHGRSLPLPWVKSGHRVLTKEQAAQATFALRTVLAGGTGQRAAVPGLDAAGKTGTSDNSHAVWFVGYVPTLSTAVTVFNTESGPVKGIPGRPGVEEGGTLPAEIWHSFMQALALPNRPFPLPAFQGQTALWTASPTPAVPPPSSAAPAKPRPSLSNPTPRGKATRSVTPACVKIPACKAARDHQAAGKTP